MPKPSYSLVERKIDAIEAEMKRIGYWSEEPLPEDAYHFQKAFAVDTMAFSQWLQFIFIPRVQGIIQQQGTFPNRSMVGTQAIREFDGDENASELIAMLCSFDGLFR